MADQFTSAHWTPEDIASATGGVWRSSTAAWTVNGVTTYRGKVKPGNVVIVPDGRNWGKGWESYRHPDFMRLKEQGAVAVVASNVPAKLPTDLPVLEVDATFRALTRMAAYSRDRFEGTMIAITGSVGKTTTKTYLRSILSSHARVFAMTGNFNGIIGVRRAMTLIPPDADYVIQECGMEKPDSIRPRARLIRPDVAIITHVLDDHMEFHASLESIARTKAALFDFLPENGVAVINRDTNHFPILRAAAGAHRTLTFGKHRQADVRLLNCRPGTSGSAVEAGILGMRISYELSTPGPHQALNSLAVLATVGALGFDVAEAADAMRSLRPAPRRGEVLEVTLPDGRLTIIDDTYNANPESMRSSLDMLRLIPPAPGGRRIAVLGAMAELGPNSRRYHEELADAVVNAEPNLVITLGDDMRSLRRVLPSDILGPHLDKVKDAEQVVPQAVRAGDVLTIKGSARGKSLGKIVDALRKLERAEAEVLVKGSSTTGDE